jgi:hypothetical protein
MDDERTTSDLHTRWLFGWERNDGDAPFDFRRVFGELYDDASQDVRLYDDFDAQGPSSPAAAPPGRAQAGSPHPYVGMWVTADGHIRQELLPNGRYDEARGGRQSAYTGSYRASGTRIDYVDDTGFTADGTFDGDVLHHGGYVFYRQGSDALKRATETGP